MSRKYKSPEPLVCWHCEESHSPTQEFCPTCNGWTLPTLTVTQEKIHLKTFVLKDSDSQEVKKVKMIDAATAISGDKFVAVLGIQFVNNTFGQNSSLTAVFVHRPGGDKRVSTSKSKFSASSRDWENIEPAFWEKFKQRVGIEGNVYTLPDAFPSPGGVCCCHCHIEKDS